MRRRSGAAALAVFLPWLLAGCYGRQLVRGPITTEENAEALAEIQAEQARQEERIEGLEELLEEQNGLLRSIRAEDAVGREQIFARLDELETRFGENENRLDRVAGKVDRVTYQLSRGGAPAADGEAPDGDAAMIDPKALYDAAYLDLVRGNYAAAVSGFEAYLQAYPRSVLSDDARYWIGECRLAEGMPEEAAEHFLLVERDFPDSERVPAALLRLAACRIELGDRDEARKTLTRILDRFPRSVEAPLARERLGEIE
ncbi:MAG: tol-pal system protein YbgF [Candidatus Eisenbacteria bacterium]|nr:tol-pal system protein YbgF [Candidatus Eisenbacteria bacterium]